MTRFPEIATLVAHPADGTVLLTFAVTGRIDRATETTIGTEIADHVAGLLAAVRDTPEVLEVVCEHDEQVSFVRVRRDVRSFSREELVILTQLVAGRFGERLVRSPQSEPLADEDLEAQDELVEYAIEALRDPSSQKSLVGFHEERGVLVYFLKTRK
ncbi:MAG: hypothetical protein ACREM8_15165, partial [Vulcanimicrobiaceae bacterium]